MTTLTATTTNDFAVPATQAQPRMSRSFFLGVIGFAHAVDLVAAGWLLAERPSRPPDWWLALEGGVFLVLAVVFCTFLHRIWASVQDGSRASTTPGWAVGKLFIPFYNIYWSFAVLPRFVYQYNRVLDRRNLVLPRLDAGIYRFYPWLSTATFFLAAVPALGVLLALVTVAVKLTLMSQTCDAINRLSADSTAAIEVALPNAADLNSEAASRAFGAEGLEATTATQARALEQRIVEVAPLSPMLPKGEA